MPAIILRPTEARQNTKATFVVTFQGFPEGQEIEVRFWEVETSTEANNHGQEQLIGAVRGRLERWTGGTPTSPVLTLRPSSAPPQASGEARIGFVFPLPGTPQLFVFNIPSDRYNQFEGDYWEIQARVENPAVQSPTFNVARVRRALPTLTRDSVATYDWHAGNDVTLYNDASEDEGGTRGAFHDIEQAIRDARHFIFIADWSFHPYVRLRHGAPVNVGSTLGRLLIDQAHANPEMLVAIHTWDHTNVAMPDPQNDWGERILNIIAGGTRPANLLWRASSRTGVGWSHHQKFVVLDCAGAGGRREIKAFFGGLDLTKGRFDWGEHPILPSDSRSRQFLAQIRGRMPGRAWDSDHDYDDWYNGEFGDNRSLPREPWHDIHAQIVGPTAWDFVREFVGRWNLDPAYPDAQGDDSDATIQRVLDQFLALFDRTRFVQQWEHRQGRWAGQVYRSMVREHWGSDDPVTSPAQHGERREFEWRVSGNVESSIQRAYLQAIGQADRFLYIETQYLIGSGGHWGRSSVRNQVPEAIVERIIDRIRRGLPFHAYLVMPMFPEGDPPSAPNIAQRYFEWKTIEYMARAVHAQVGARWQDYLSFYFLAQWHNVDSLRTTGSRQDRVRANQRYMIYVHSKMMIVDDRYVIIGSANLNERSLAGGRDSEICVGLWPPNNRVEQDCIQQIQQFRQCIWQEHLGPGMPAQWQQPESAACVQAVHNAALQNYIRFREGRRQGNEGHLCMWPLYVDQDEFYFRDIFSSPDHQFTHHVIPDGEFPPILNTGWLFYPTGAGVIGRTDIAE